MGNESLLRPKVQQWIRNATASLSSLAFKGSPFADIPLPLLLQQVEGWRKVKDKLPVWHETPNLLFPPKLSIEQCSSAITAKYKAGLISGSSMADITGGFGVDAYYFAQKFDLVHYFERNADLCAIAQHNFKQLSTPIVCAPKDGLNAIKGQRYDAIYVDPARRHDAKGKVFFLEDCSPDLTEHLPALLQSAPVILVKTSPMLDLSKGLDQFGTVASVHVVAVQNEVKELLWVITAAYQQNPMIYTINYNKKETETFDFQWGNSVKTSYHDPLVYLYEPNAALLKAGAFDALTAQYAVQKIAHHAHLYTCSDLIDFPGRRFVIEQQFPYTKATMAQFKKTKCHVTTRHFPETVSQLRDKWRLSDGGDCYLFFTTLNSGQKVVLRTHKI